MAATEQRHCISPDEESIFGLPEAPVFYPTPEEFRDPWKYLNKIRHIIQKTGICVIQPPHEEDGWDFESFYKYIDPKTFPIVTKAQNVHQMQYRNGPSVQFARELIKFWAQHGRPLSLLPEVNGIVVDFLRLKNEVEARGGFEKVEAETKWKEIARTMHLLSPSDPEALQALSAMTLRNHYVQHLQPFLKGFVPPKPSPTPAPNPNAPTTVAPPGHAPTTKIQRRCKSCRVLLQFPPETLMIKCPKCATVAKTVDLIPVNAPPPSPATSSPAANSSSNTPASSTSSSSAPAAPKKEMQSQKCVNEICRVTLQFPVGTLAIKCPRCQTIMKIPPAQPPQTPASTSQPPASQPPASTPSQAPTSNPAPSPAPNPPKLPPATLSPPMNIKQETPINRELAPKHETPIKQEPSDLSTSETRKRQLESSDASSKETATKKRRLDDEPLWKQVRSRSFAKDAYDRSMGDGGCDDNDDDSDDEMDEEIPESTRGRAMSNMSRMGGMQARKVFKNKQVKEEEEDILESLTKDFGYDMGYTYTLEGYKEMADAFENRWKSVCSTPKEKETEYWRIVEGGAEWVSVQYGSDLDVGKHGSGFPLNPNAKERAHAIRARHWLKARTRRRKPKPSEYMTTSGWNTNNLADATFLHHLNESVAGVTRPMIYVGMLFSSFCWHTEDNYLYSINYLHTGSPKKWYGIPYDGAEGFEKCMREELPELFEKTPNLLHLLVTQLSPRILKKAGVPVYTALQKKGQFVITCPRAYHAGFNTGFNVAESVNFALEDWLTICRKAVNDYRFSRSAEMVLKAAAEPDSPEIAQIVRAELVNVIHTEQKGLSDVFASGITQYVDLSSKNYTPCEHCGYDCYISGVVCSNHPNRIACLHHIKDVCSCSNEHKRVGIRVRLADMKKLLDGLNEYLGENTLLERSLSNSS